MDGSNPSPSPTISGEDNTSAPNPKYTEWTEQDQLIKLLIVSTLIEEAMGEVIGCHTSQEVWTSLSAAFSHKLKAREHRLKADLQLLQKGTRSVGEYAREFCNICDQLLAIGAP